MEYQGNKVRGCKGAFIVSRPDPNRLRPRLEQPLFSTASAKSLTSLPINHFGQRLTQYPLYDCPATAENCARAPLSSTVFDLG